DPGPLAADIGSWRLIALRLIHTDNRPHKVIRTIIYFQHLLHSSHKFAVMVRGNHPVFLFPGFKFVFLKLGAPSHGKSPPHTQTLPPSRPACEVTTFLSLWIAAAADLKAAIKINYLGAEPTRY